MGKEYAIVDHKERVNIELGKALVSLCRFQFATNDEIIQVLLTKDNIEFGDEEIEVGLYEDMSIKEYINGTRSSKNSI